VPVVEMQVVRRGHCCASVIRRAPFTARFVERHIHPGLEFIVQDHTSNVLSGSEHIGLGLAHHPVQAGVVPDFRRLDPAGVIDLANVTRVVAMVVEQSLAGGRGAHDVGGRAIAEPCRGSTVDQPLSLERRQIRGRSSNVVDFRLQVVRKHRSVAGDALQEIHF
jgi:hypothetical protein